MVISRNRSVNSRRSSANHDGNPGLLFRKLGRQS